MNGFSKIYILREKKFLSSLTTWLVTYNGFLNNFFFHRLSEILVKHICRAFYYYPMN